MRHIILLALPLLVDAQTPGTLAGPRMSVPALGYVFDENARAIRLVSGVPGAAGFDRTIATEIALETAFVQSSGKTAIANAKEGNVALVTWTGEVRVVPIESALSRATLVAFARRGERVAISDGATVEIWDSLRGTPVRTAGFAVEEGIHSLALSEEGVVAIGTRSGTLVTRGPEPRVVLTGASVTGLAFLANGELLAAEAGGRTLLRIRDAASSPASSVVVFLEQEPGAIAASADGEWAAVAVSEDVLSVNLTSGRIRSLGCACRVERFDSLEGNLVLHAVDTRTGARLLLDVGSVEPRAALIPEIGGAAR